MRWVTLHSVVLACFILTLSGCKTDEKAMKESNFIYSLKIDGAITPTSLESLEDALEKSEKDGASALILFLDTPGGLATSMDGMIRKIMASPVPVITYVGPPGASCGSAGVYIMYASHIAAMAPGTNIGSATPVMIDAAGGSKEGSEKHESEIPKTAGADDAVNLKRKQINHAVAQIQSLAEYHGRNADFGARTVTEAANITSTEALRIRAIDLIASTVDELIQSVEGRTVRLASGNKTLNLKGMKVIAIETDFRSSFLAVLTNPALASILLMLGMLGIFAEIQYPGTVFPGVFGAICLVLGLYAMQTLPVNYAGYALLALGMIFLILEVKIVSYGLLSVSGIVCLVLGAILLVRSAGGLSAAAIGLIGGTAFAIGLTMASLVYLVAKAQKGKVVSGVEQLLSETGIAETEINAQGGRVFLHSEIWSATSNEIIPKGSKIQVVDRNGMLLTVKVLTERRIT